MTDTQCIAKFLAKWRFMTEAEKWAFIAKLDRLDKAEVQQDA